MRIARKTLRATGVVLLSTLLLPAPSAYAIQVCYDYVIYRLTGVDPRPPGHPAEHGSSIVDMKATLKKREYELVIPSPGSSEIKPDDVILVAGHVGYVTARNAIDHFVQVEGTSRHSIKYPAGALPANPKDSNGNSVRGGFFAGDTLDRFMTRPFSPVTTYEVYRRKSKEKQRSSDYTGLASLTVDDLAQVGQWRDGSLITESRAELTIDPTTGDVRGVVVLATRRTSEGCDVTKTRTSRLVGRVDPREDRIAGLTQRSSEWISHTVHSAKERARCPQDLGGAQEWWGHFDDSGTLSLYASDPGHKAGFMARLSPLTSTTDPKPPNPDPIRQPMPAVEPIDDIVLPSGPVIRTAKQTYRPNDTITVSYSGLPGNSRDWISVVESGAADDRYVAGQWQYTDGQRAGNITVGPLPAGSYEVRVYYDWAGGGGYVVHSRHRFDVQSDALPGDRQGFNGTWSTGGSWGDLVLRQEGSRVHGTYSCCGAGTISGTATGDRLLFSWSRSSGGGGEAFLILKHDGTIDGKWCHGAGCDASRGSAYSGTRK